MIFKNNVEYEIIPISPYIQSFRHGKSQVVFGGSKQTWEVQLYADHQLIGQLLCNIIVHTIFPLRKTQELN